MSGNLKRASLNLRADALALRELGEWLSELLVGAGSEATTLHGRVELAVHEVCMNVIDHAYAKDQPGPADSSEIPGSQIPGSQIPGSEIPGESIDGIQIDGIQIDGIQIDGIVDSTAVLIQIRDRGTAFDSAGVVPPVAGVPQIRGYGLVIVEKLADEVTYTRSGGLNIWSLKFDRSGNRQEN